MVLFLGLLQLLYMGARHAVHSSSQQSAVGSSRLQQAVSDHPNP